MVTLSPRKEAACLIVAVVLGLILFFLSATVLYDPDLAHCGACMVYGYPYYYSIEPPTQDFGLALSEPAFYLNLVFWLIVSVASVEILSHLPRRVRSRLTSAYNKVVPPIPA